LKIKFIGTRSSVKEKTKTHQNRSSLLIESEGKKLLIDWGDENKADEFPKIDYLIITHCHPDHLDGILRDDFIEDKKKYREVKLFLSEDTIIKRNFHTKFPSFLSINIFKRRDCFKIEPFEIHSIPVLHSVKCPNIALFIKDKDKKICFASDVVNIKKEDRDTHLVGCNVYIGDGSSIKKGGLVYRTDSDMPIGHADVRTQLAWCRDANIEHCIFTHWGTIPLKLGDEKLNKIISGLEEEYRIRIQVACDGVEVEI
jgi:ribonuclease BN (tRNA processing enzyme)